MLKMRNILAALLAVLVCVCPTLGALAETQSGVLAVWASPSSDDSVNAKPMLRFWFPDAGAGLPQQRISELYQQGLSKFDTEYLGEVSEILRYLYDAGFGGVEMTMLADSANYGPELVGDIGWGSEAWVRVLCQALMTGNGLGKGDGSSFKVDVTMTAHWPLIIDTIDPNDDQQQQELHYVIQSVAAQDAERVELQLPEQKVQDSKSGVFLFKDTLVGVALAKTYQKEVDVERQMGWGPTAEVVIEKQTKDYVDFESLTPLTYSEVPMSSAGVPEGAVIYRYTDGRYYDLAKAGTGDAMSDPLKEGESVALYPSEAYHTLTDEKNGGYIYIVDNQTGGALAAEGLSCERVDDFTQMGPMVTWNSHFVVMKDGQEISDQVTVYFDSGKATHMGGVLQHADGTSEPIQVIANASRASFGVVEAGESGATERQYMDDIQMCYTVRNADVQAAIEKAGALEGDEQYALIPVYRRGSGQVSSGGGTVTMDNRTYCISYYDAEGAHAVIDYWENNMLDIPVEAYDDNGTAVSVTLRQMLKGNSAGSIFEDSLELSTDGSAWGAHMLEDFQKLTGYDAGTYLPVIAGVEVYNDQTGTAVRVLEDYDEVKEETFSTEHEKVISEWANSIGGGYRFQSGSDDARNSTYVDIIEADNGSLSSVLKAAGTVNAKGDADHPYLSMEAITSTSIDADYYSTMIELNMNFVRGINRIVIHGIPFNKSLNGHINVWPGWVFGEPSLGKGYGTWAKRQAFYSEDSDIKTFTDYVTRIQGLLQRANTRVPVMIVGSASDADFALLRDHGYHYNVTSEYGMMYDNMDAANIADGVLHSDTLATQMVVLRDLGDTVGQSEFLARIVEYAEKGVTIVIYGNTDISKLAGEDRGETHTDAYVSGLYQKLLGSSNVVTGVSTPEQLLELVQRNVDNTISFDTTGLEAMHLTEGSDDFYLFYNSALADGYSAISYGGVGEGLDLKNVKGLDVSSPVTLNTDGRSVYSLNAYTGEITLLDGTDNGDGTTTIQMDIAAWDSAVLMVSAQQPEGVTQQNSSATSECKLDLTDADWSLAIDSYGPASDFDDAAPFNDTVIKQLSFDSLKLGLWKDLKDTVTRDQLIALGITDEKLRGIASRITGAGDKLLNGESLTVDGSAIQYVAGVGYYKTSFNWDEECNALIHFAHENGAVESDARVNGDMVTKITITNASGTHEFTGINQVSDTLDIGNALVQGENTIEVKLVTTLRNREWIEGAATGPMFNAMQNYGLTSLSISAY